MEAADTAADALAVIGMLPYRNLHRAGFFTAAAATTAFLIYLHLVEAEAVKKSIDRPQGTDVLAKRPVKNHSAGQEQNQ